MLTFHFSGVEGFLAEPETLTSGMIGKQVKFELSPEWDNLQKTAVYMAGNEVRLSVGIDSMDIIPREVLANPGHRLYVGLFGVSGDGTLAIPTIRVPGPVIQPGAQPEGDDSTDSSLEVWAQILTLIGDMEELEEENLVAAIRAISEREDVPEADIQAAVTDYLLKNPVTTGANAQERQQIQENARNIQTLQSEKLDADALEAALEQADFGKGTVNTVAGISPDDQGNVALDASDIGALCATGDTMTGHLHIGTSGYPTVYFEDGDGNNCGSVFASASNKRTYLRCYATDDSGCYENFRAPAANDGLTANKTYDILTTKTVTYGTKAPESAVGAAGIAGRIYFKKVT